MSVDETNAPFCPDGHGKMERVPGHWAFVGMDPVPTGGTLLTGLKFKPSNEAYAVTLWICPVCKIIRTYDCLGV
jgi:hypothetical protein